MNNRIKPITDEWDKINEYPEHMTPEFRKAFKLQDPYSFSEKIRDYINQKNVKAPLILVPDELQKYAYSLVKKANTGAVPEPIVLYLYVGLKGAQWDSKNVHDCNFAIVFTPEGHPTLIELHSPNQVDSVVNAYKEVVQEYKKEFNLPL